MNPKREHHILPRFYLKGFVEQKGEPFIWEYKKGEPFNPGRQNRHNPQWKSIGRPCAVRDFYAYPHDSGEMDFEQIENLLESFEAPAITVIDKIRTHQMITDDEKATFSFYITQMYRRVPSYRGALSKGLPQALAALEPEVRERFHLPDSEETRELFRRIGEQIKTQDYKTRVHLKVLANTPSSRVINVLRGMKWRFFVAPFGHSFITADNPMVPFKGLPLQHPESEVSFPISTDVALVASRAENICEGFFFATSQIVKELNRRTASKASLRAYFCRDESWVVSLLDKSRHQFVPIP